MLDTLLIYTLKHSSFFFFVFTLYNVHVKEQNLMIKIESGLIFILVEIREEKNLRLQLKEEQFRI